jgi:hypothetical protein
VGKVIGPHAAAGNGDLLMCVEIVLDFLYDSVDDGVGSLVVLGDGVGLHQLDVPVLGINHHFHPKGVGFEVLHLPVLVLAQLRREKLTIL